MKNKNMLIVGIVVLIAGLAAYMLLGRGGGAGIPGVSNKPFSGSLKAAVAMGVPMKCTYSMDGAEYEGFVKGESYYGTMDVNGQTGTVILKDDCMWSWEEGAKQGVKTCFEFDAEDESIWDNPETVDTDLSYNCNPAVITDAKFTPPSDVEFLDLSSMMDGAVSEEDLEKLMEGFEGY